MSNFKIQGGQTPPDVHACIWLFLVLSGFLMIDVAFFTHDNLATLV